MPFNTDKIIRIDPFTNPHILYIYTKNGKKWFMYKCKGKMKLSKKWVLEKI